LVPGEEAFTYASASGAKVTGWPEMAVGVGVLVAALVGVEVAVAFAVAVVVAVELLPAGRRAMSCARLETVSVSSLAVPTAVSPVVLLTKCASSAVLPLEEAAFFKS
jgi:hypothetical protein